MDRAHRSMIRFANAPVRSHIGNMSPEQEDAVRRALELFPGSLRALGREAGVSYRLLGMIRDGQRTATTETVEALADAFERLRDRHDEGARILRESLNQEET